MATQAAGRNLPDLVQMDYGYIFDYARRRALLPLDEFVGKQLDLSGFTPQSVDGGRVDGKIYGVSLGLNSTAHGLRPRDLRAIRRGPARLADDLGRDGPPRRRHHQGGGQAGLLGHDRQRRLRPRLRGVARRARQAICTPPKAASAPTRRTWPTGSASWAGLREQGACVAPEVQSLDKLDIDTNGVSTGKCALTLSNSNQLVGFQALNRRKLDLAMYPAGASSTKSGQVSQAVADVEHRGHHQGRRRLPPACSAISCPTPPPAACSGWSVAFPPRHPCARR